MHTRVVVLTDLHLGSDDCILSKEAAERDERTYEEQVAHFLIDPVRDHLAQTGHGSRAVDYLVLDGDVLDFAIQSYEKAFSAGRRFFQALAKARPPLFREIVYIPGNHDHNVWEMVQHEVCVTRRIARGDLPRPYPHVQPGVLTVSDSGADLELPGVSAGSDRQGPRYGDIFLRGLYGPSGPQIPINVAYPNLLIQATGQGGRPIMVTHGHFFCLPWIVMTEVFPKTLGVECTLTLRELEEINAPLTKFGWTSLGQAGKLTDVADGVWNGIRSGDTSETAKVLDELGCYLDEKVFKGGKWSPKEWLSDGAIKLVKSWLLRSLAGVNVGMQRFDSEFLRKDESKGFIRSYCRLSKAAYSGLPGLGEADLPGHVVFGHTHVLIPPDDPDATIEVDGERVCMPNPGGWLGTKGAAAVTVREDGEVGYVELVSGS